MSPDHTIENQIDHTCINKMFKISLQDVRLKRGADVASNHHLLTVRLKLKEKLDGDTNKIYKIQHRHYEEEKCKSIRQY